MYRTDIKGLKKKLLQVNDHLSLKVIAIIGAIVLVKLRLTSRRDGSDLDFAIVVFSLATLHSEEVCMSQMFHVYSHSLEKSLITPKAFKDLS